MMAPVKINDFPSYPYLYVAVEYQDTSKNIRGWTKDTTNRFSINTGQLKMWFAVLKDSLTLVASSDLSDKWTYELSASAGVYAATMSNNVNLYTETTVLHDPGSTTTVIAASFTKVLRLSRVDLSTSGSLYCRRLQKSPTRSCRSLAWMSMLSARSQ